ncbi:FMN-dependent NADH-azoreductase [Pseudomonas sp. 21LCFQ010]|uniref:FMN-dependent NADH-azoreductase n=1 Tax=Pseudomonas sp. 21LCFQ010 TaxID=2957506 RepID=UPI0020971259|nr:FMN-dependent NADH-azoreductase [Pseudomonas sp. 21LCFQ010]MCO8161883.1 FMN-dependent NADH-azoreductase [Pseudomonas sp. 21LCFQ010]
MTILHIDSSILGEHSASRQLSLRVAQAIQAAEPDSQLVYRDLARDELGHFSAASLAAAGTPEQSRSAAQQQEAAHNQAILDEFLGADVLVVGAPMYNFTIPSQLKAWFDRIMVAGKTFRYSESGPEGLCTGKKVIVVSTAGGLHVGQPTGVGHEELLKALFGFIGITEVKFVRAHGLAYGDVPRAQALHAAQQDIEETLLA